MLKLLSEVSFVGARSFEVPTAGWIPREAHREVVLAMLSLGLIKSDNSRSLPLKSGGKTDVYVNLRDARSKALAINFLASLFSRPVMWIRPDRFIEVPDSVSCIAGPLSMMTDTPYVTIRAEAKEGRVADAKTIGEFHAGESVVILDDVVTNGASKVGPYKVCKEKGLNVKAILVLVDRQQGWEADFRKYDIEAPVWAGMTLHDVRRELIALGHMERCSLRVEDNNKIIAALDGKSLQETLSIADRLRPTGCILKVNDLLIGEGIDHLLPELSTYGRVMADLKSYDITNTVNNVMDRLAKHDPWAVTLHASGGGTMLRDARSRLRNTKVLAITVLTSFDNETCQEIYHRLPLAQVKSLAKTANDAGADGLVCSPEEVAMLRRLYPHMLLVVPGVRSPGAEKHDQKRVDTPANTIEAGADYLVMGRQVINNPDPVAEVQRVHQEELKIAA